MATRATMSAEENVRRGRAGLPSPLSFRDDPKGCSWGAEEILKVYACFGLCSSRVQSSESIKKAEDLRRGLFRNPRDARFVLLSPIGKSRPENGTSCSPLCSHPGLSSLSNVHVPPVYSKSTALPSLQSLVPSCPASRFLSRPPRPHLCPS